MKSNNYHFCNISIHALRGEGDSLAASAVHLSRISIHALRGEGDYLIGGNICIKLQDFNPRPPWGGRRVLRHLHLTHLSVFQSTPSVGRATFVTPLLQNILWISIHALRGEGDFTFAKYQPMRCIISIHALRGEGDYVCTIGGHRFFGISIHALRGEGDYHLSRYLSISFYFNPRPPWGGRQKVER